MTRLNVPYRSSPLAACMWLMSIWYCAVSMATVTVRLKPLGGCQSSLLTLPVKSFMSPPSAMSSVVIGNSNVDSCKTKLDHPYSQAFMHYISPDMPESDSVSRAEQSRAEQSRAEQSRAVLQPLDMIAVLAGLSQPIHCTGGQQCWYITVHHDANLMPQECVNMLVHHCPCNAHTTDSMHSQQHMQ